MELTKDLELIAGDASDRKFYRLRQGSKSLICMQFPKWEGGYGGDPLSWIGMCDALHKMGIPVPQIVEVQKEKLCIWTEDLGDRFLAYYLSNHRIDKNNPECRKTIDFYKQSLLLLVHAQYPGISLEHPALHRYFDFEKLFYEMEFFIKHFLNGFLGQDVSREKKEWALLYEDFENLCKKLGSFEKVLCHRDYHVRNIMVKDEKIYWIDFQDARMGPHSYDVVSLVRDSYVQMDWDMRFEFFDYYFEALNKARTSQNLAVMKEDNWQEECRLMGLQRNIKALGSFGYLATQKGKKDYLKYVGNTLNILCSDEAIKYKNTDLRASFPHVFRLLESLAQGPLSGILERKIAEASL